MNPNDLVNQPSHQGQKPNLVKIDFMAILARNAAKQKAAKAQAAKAATPADPGPLPAAGASLRLASDTHPRRHTLGRYRVFPIDF